MMVELGYLRQPPLRKYKSNEEVDRQQNREEKREKKSYGKYGTNQNRRKVQSYIQQRPEFGKP